MAMILNDEQILLQQSAQDLSEKVATVEQFRTLRDAKQRYHDPALWQQIAALGWTGIIIPEDWGGSEFGYLGLGLVLQQLGRHLTPSPLFSTGFLAAELLIQAGSNQQKDQYLPKIVDGSAIFSFAHEEHTRHSLNNISFSAQKQASGYILSGEKVFVIDGELADHYLVTARTSGQRGDPTGISIFILDADIPGLTKTQLTTVDSRNVANLGLDQVKVEASACLGELGNAAPLLQNVFDKASILLASEMLGAAEQVFESTIDYLKEREQFGVTIGSFQALKHRAADMFVELDIAKSVVREALSALDEGSKEISQLASLAKTRLNDCLTLITNEGVQMHGGMGMTDEFDIGLYMKRSRVTNQLFGDSHFHRDRFASLGGY
ncbi:MAG: acyl-CoA dehydrogenase [Gammaproteobacteria bacterium]|nr:MAG: acyl-CoA dehydrogenase [Gammaproteobacteria bacterium]